MRAEVRAIVDAAWQVLDDMGADGQSCCLAAKAQLRVAIEPFVPGVGGDEDLPMDWPLSEAQAILTRIEQ